MPVLHSSLQVLAWLTAMAWLYKLIEVFFGLPQVPNLTDPERNLSPAGDPRITVIVPARNEAANIAAGIESLLGQDYPHLQILAINDRSTDATGAILDALAAANPNRLNALHVIELPPNWLGKTHAMALAARHAIAEHAPDYLLFTDADVVFQSAILRRALAYVAETSADHFVAMPTTVAKSAGEAMILTYLHVLSLWAARPWRVADPDARDAIGVGAFNLVRTVAYLQIGGFEAASMEILEDLNLAHRIKKARLRQRIAAAPGWVTVHWAAGTLGLVNNMTKNLFAIFRFRAILLLVAAGNLAGLCLFPLACLAVPGLRLPGLLSVACIVGLYALSSRRSGISARYAALFPVAASLFIYSMLRSMVVTLAQGGVIWRGTFYPLTTLRRRGKNSAF